MSRARAHTHTHTHIYMSYVARPPLHGHGT